MRTDKLLREGLGQLGMAMSGGQADAFALYLRELRRWNRAYSLTSLKDEGDIVIKHFLDSCLYLLALPADARSVADVGSGAGFPGVPLKIMRPGLEVVLIEPNGKKAAFLRHMGRTLGLGGLEVLHRRLEDVEGLQVDVAVTRALYAVGEFVRKAAHIVRDGGLFVLSKGPRVARELRGLSLRYELLEAALPMTDIRRTLVMLRKAP